MSNLISLFLKGIITLTLLFRYNDYYDLNSLFSMYLALSYCVGKYIQMENDRISLPLIQSI